MLAQATRRAPTRSSSQPATGNATVCVPRNIPAPAANSPADQPNASVQDAPSSAQAAEKNGVDPKATPIPAPSATRHPPCTWPAATGRSAWCVRGGAGAFCMVQR